MASTGPLPIEDSGFGWIKATLRIFIRAPLFFTLLIGVQYLSSTLLGLVARPGVLSSTSYGLLDFLVSDVLFAIAQVPVILRASRLLAGEPTSARLLLAVTVRRALPVFAVVIGQLVLTLLGGIAFIVPGILAMLAFALAEAVCILETASPLKSLYRSAELTRGVRWRLLGAYMLLILPSLLVALVMGIAQTKSVAPMRNAELVGNCIFAVSGAWLTILSTVVYDLRRPDRRQPRITEVFA